MSYLQKWWTVIEEEDDNITDYPYGLYVTYKRVNDTFNIVHFFIINKGRRVVYTNPYTHISYVKWVDIMGKCQWDYYLWESDEVCKIANSKDENKMVQLCKRVNAQCNGFYAIK